VGVVKLHLSLFPGSSPCGWVRGTTLTFQFGDKEFRAWSTQPLLPDDAARPGKGWTVFGVLEPDPSLKSSDAYYGSFDPSQAGRSRGRS
jgi:hypothetical protein